MALVKSTKPFAKFEWMIAWRYIRAKRAEDLGLMRMIHSERDGTGPDAMINAIRKLPDQKPPSFIQINGLLDGLDVVTKRTSYLLNKSSLQANK